MDREALQRRLLETFLDELTEHVETLERGVLALEREPDAELVRRLFRAAHSLKGAARAVHLPAVERTCHALEDVLAAVRDGRLTVTAERSAALLAAVDGVGNAGRSLRSGTPPASDRLDAAAAALQAIVAGASLEAARQAVPSEARATTVAPPAATASTEPPTPAVPPPATTSPAASPVGESVRIAADKVDALLAWSGELLVARRRIVDRPRELDAVRSLARQVTGDWRLADRSESSPASRRRFEETLRRLEREIDRLATTMAGDARALEQVSAPLDEAVRRIRMLPFTHATQGLERAARDLGRAAGKDVDLEVRGGEVEIDRAVIEQLRDPLRHLVRNAVDHGIEAPADRAAAGKRPRGAIRLTAELRGTEVEIEIADDGRGFDAAAIRRRAGEAGIAEPADDSALPSLLFLPGFSTARGVTDVSGRGVGLDVVKTAIEALHGTVTASSDVGRGARFRLRVPLTLAILRALMVRARDSIFALAASQVSKLLRVRAEETRMMDGRSVLLLADGAVPLVSLATVLELPGGDPPRPAVFPAVLASAGDQRVAFVVDELVGEQEIVVKGLGRRIRRARTVAGATLLPSGRIAMVLNLPRLLRRAAAGSGRGAVAAAPPRERRRLLVVDDSLTTRTLEKSVLEAAGYEVAVAADGESAWQLLQQQSIDLVVSDVDMPVLDGLGLTSRLRASERFRRLPVILVTARESEADRRRGLEIGADAYLAKSAFDQRALLETVAQLL